MRRSDRCHCESRNGFFVFCVMAGHPRLVMREQRKTWMAGPSPAMTTRQSRGFLSGAKRRSNDMRRVRQPTDDARSDHAATPRACSRCNARSIHCAVSFSCTPFCASRSCSAGKSTWSSAWSWLKQENTTRPLAGRRIDLRLQALRADLLHHALHRRVDRADRGVARLQQRRQHAVPRRADRLHHAVRADDDHVVRLRQPDIGRRTPPFACTMLPTKLRSCGRVGANPGASSQHQTMTSAARSISATL